MQDGPGAERSVNSEEVPDDREHIPNYTPLLRSFSPEFLVEVEGGGVRPSGQAFQAITDKETGLRAMSVYRADVLDALDVPYEAIVENHPEQLIVRLPAERLREQGLGIIAAAGPGRVGPAHCHVFGNLTRGKRSRIADAVAQDPGAWIKGPEGTASHHRPPSLT